MTATKGIPGQPQSGWEATREEGRGHSRWPGQPRILSHVPYLCARFPTAQVRTICLKAMNLLMKYSCAVRTAVTGSSISGVGRGAGRGRVMICSNRISWWERHRQPGPQGTWAWEGEQQGWESPA